MNKDTYQTLRAQGLPAGYALRCAKAGDRDPGFGFDVPDTPHDESHTSNDGFRVELEAVGADDVYLPNIVGGDFKSGRNYEDLVGGAVSHRRRRGSDRQLEWYVSDYTIEERVRDHHNRGVCKSEAHRLAVAELLREYNLAVDICEDREFVWELIARASKDGVEAGVANLTGVVGWKGLRNCWEEVIAEALAEARNNEAAHVRDLAEQDFTAECVKLVERAAAGEDIRNEAAKLVEKHAAESVES